MTSQLAIFPEDGICVGTKESYCGVAFPGPREVESGVCDGRSFLDETQLMVNDVGFMISEDLTLGPETRLDHSGFLCGSFITVKRGSESF